MARSQIELVILIAVSILLGLAVNIIKIDGIPLFGEWDPKTGSLHAGGPCTPETRELADADIVNLYTSKTALFLDARKEEDYVEGHIPGAVHLPVGRFDDFFMEFSEIYPSHTRIVCYCSGVDCHDSHDLASLLKDSGYSSIIVYARGMAGWTELGLPIEAGYGNE